MRKLFHTSWISVLALGLLAGGAIYYCGWTESGLQHLVRLFSRRIGPVTLEISGARGTLHGGLHVDRVVVEHERVRVVALGVDGRVALLPLLWQTIRVTQARFDDVQVHVLPHTDKAGLPWKPHFLVGLLNIEAERVDIKHAELITPGGTSLIAEQLSAAGQAGTTRIRIFDSTLHYAGFEVRSAGSVLAANAIGLQGTIRLSMDAPGQPAWLASTQIDGDLNRLGVTGVLLAPFNADFRGEARALSGDFHWQGASQVRNLDLRAWGAGSALGVISGTLQLSGDRHGFAAQGSLEPPGLKAGPLAVDFAGSYAARVLSIDRASVTHRASSAQLSGSGQIGMVSGGPRLDLHGQWRDFRWPLTDAAAPVHSSSGTYTLSGLRPFALTASGALQLLSEPPLQFRAAGQLGHDALDIENAVVDSYGGQAQLHGSLSWSPLPGWSATGVMHALNVAALRPAVSGRLSFLFDAAGQGFGKGSALQAKFTEISGNVRGQRASGHAGIALSGNEWLLQQVRVQLGATRIEADGHLGSHPDLRFAIAAEDLALFSSDAHGRLQAAGHVGGDERNPLLLMRVSGAGLKYAGVTLSTLNANIDFDPRGSGHADSDLRFDHLTVGDHTIDHARFTTSGTAGGHHFTMLLDAAPLNVQGSGTASFSNGVWRAQLTEFTAGDGRDLHLALAAPAALVAALNGDELRLERLCLHDAQAMLCVAGAHLPGHSEVALSAANVPLRTLTAGAASDTDFEGTLSLDAHAEASAAALWTGTLSATLAGAEVRHHISGGRVESFSLGTGKVQAGLDAAGLTARVALDAGADGSVAGHLLASRTGEAWRSWPLTGELHLQTKALGFIDSYVAQIDRVSGQLDANLTLAGTLAAPGLNGELKVTGAEVDAYQINLALRDLNFEARLKDNMLQLAGSANAGNDGHARFDGELVWRNALPYGQVHLAGENLRIVNIPEARVQASPDVIMKFAGRRIDISGTVTLPYARLQRPTQLTNAVRASSDEVIVGAGQGPPGDAFHVFSDLTLRLGERVTIDTLGLAGRLSGSVRAVTNDTGLSLGTGEVRVEEGKYTYYGRQLDIQRGRLLFNSGPLSDPAIDLSAIKKFPDITAGVNVRGTLRDPRVTFFSDPAVSQSQIVSLLLAGGSLETVQNTSEPSQRTNAARNAALLQGSALVVQQFGSKVGIEDVGVESDLNNETALVLGRYLSPRLYISYGISLAESINTFKMRYTVGDHWTIKTEVGIARSADLVYTIER